MYSRQIPSHLSSCSCWLSPFFWGDIAFQRVVSLLLLGDHIALLYFMHISDKHSLQNTNVVFNQFDRDSQIHTIFI